MTKSVAIVTGARQGSGISGSKAVLARAASQGPGKAAPAVLSFVQEWRARNNDEGEKFRIIV
jgi:hypothetical protein